MATDWEERASEIVGRLIEFDGDGLPTETYTQRIAEALRGAHAEGVAATVEECCKRICADCRRGSIPVYEVTENGKKRGVGGCYQHYLGAAKRRFVCQASRIRRHFQAATTRVMEVEG